MPDDERANLLSAIELAKMFRISRATLYRMLTNGPATGRNRGLGIDVRSVPSRWFGGHRWWSKEAAEQLLATMTMK
ncbi:MAG TPA: hypothetical protein VFH61_17430 [Thermoleophilia bacterium]|nr:hypothetical protein [Thermoleophilia bacterium]